MAPTHNPEQAPGDGLYGPESAQTPTAGIERRPGGEFARETGTQSLDGAESAPQPPNAPREADTNAGPPGARQAPSGLDGRARYAADIECAIGLNIGRGGTAGVTAARDAVLAVHDSELGQLRAERDALAAMFAGLERLLATSARDWGDYRADAWLYAVLIGWDCEEEHDPCDCAAMREVAQLHGWDDATVAKARRYRDAVRRVRTEAAEGGQP